MLLTGITRHKKQKRTILSYMVLLTMSVSYFLPNRGTSYLIFASFLTLALFQTSLITNALSAPPTASKLLLTKAISITKKANSNPIFAEEACSLWTEAIQDETLIDFAETMHALYASVLARVGRDREALKEYEASLKLLENSGATSKAATKAEIDIRLGMGKCLQRLLRYGEARNAFLAASKRCGGDGVVGSGWESISRSESLRRAALCSMRLGDLVSAINTLNHDEEYLDPETAGILGGLFLLRESSSVGVSRNNEQSSERALELLRLAVDKSYSPLFDWLHYTAESKQRIGKTLFASVPEVKCDIFLSFAGVNNSPFDDSDLIHLDDKILLHSLMTRTPLSKSNSKNFWPIGCVLPDDYNSFSEEHVGSSNGKNELVRWMLKDRAGYGSHGNRVASAGEIHDLFSSELSRINPKDSILCQRIVDPPMTIKGRKFSLRIYVIYFPPCQQNGIPAEVHLSSLGLVKFASAVYDGETALTKTASIGDQYMTNSGRGDGRSSDQHDLEYLRGAFEIKGLDFDEMWRKIKYAVRTVMREFLELKNDQSVHSETAQRNYQPFGTIPKILGFDFMIDSFQNPWLLEVNRFPGLEPRSNLDSDVKHAVIYDAWVAAAKRTDAPIVFGPGFRPPSGSTNFSLEEISI